jgi:hypothetical protein
MSYGPDKRESWRRAISVSDDPVDLLATRTFAVFDGGGEGRPGDLCLRLLDGQKRTWIDCQRGYESLTRAEERTVRCEGFSVIIQHNPGRTASTEARVGERDIACRPCFLCPDRLPAEQKAVLYERDYAVLCNPMPVFPSHFTVACLSHVPQTIGDNAAVFFRLIEDFGEGWTVLYNGAKCGASAPDHLHFQVVPAGLLPIEKEITEKDRLIPVKRADGTSIYRARALGREALLLVAGRAEDLLVPFASCLSALGNGQWPDGAAEQPQIGLAAIEPMMNLIGFVRDERVFLVIFPRHVHRPAAFFLSGDGRIAVSPAVAEMGGVIVTPVARDFVRLNADIVEGIYREVSLGADSMDQVIDAI